MPNLLPQSPAIFCIGGLTLDRKIKSLAPLHLGTSNPVSSVVATGGVAHNVARNLVQWTDNVSLQSVVGDDSEGRYILKILTQTGINIEHILVLNQATAVYQAVLEKNGELFLALADMGIFDHIPPLTFTNAWQAWAADDIIFIDTNLPSLLLEKAILMAQTKRIKLCIDPVSVAKSQKLPASLASVFLIKPDRFEAEALTNIRIHDCSDCIQAGKILLDRGVEHCIISLGQDGYVLINDRIQQAFPAVKLNRPVEDVTGAGDAFIAGVLYQLKQGEALVAACQFGATAASRVLDPAS